jgi:hypothetical protein
VNQRGALGWRDAWAVIRTSAENRLGRPLLAAYALLALVGLAVVGISVVLMHW